MTVVHLHTPRENAMEVALQDYRGAYARYTAAKEWHGETSEECMGRLEELNDAFARMMAETRAGR